MKIMNSHYNNNTNFDRIIVEIIKGIILIFKCKDKLYWLSSRD